jgi:hypothetical protein
LVSPITESEKLKVNIMRIWVVNDGGGGGGGRRGGEVGKND